MFDHAKSRRESMRWYLLLTLYNARPVGASEELILATLQGIYADVTQREIRVELDYLVHRALIDLVKHPSGSWSAGLSHYGVDVVEYTIDVDPGIARPVRI